MKKLIAIILALTIGNYFLVAQTIDLRTGVYSNGQPKMLPAWDAWEVVGPYANPASMPTTGFQSAPTTNDYMYGPTHTNPIIQFPPQATVVPQVCWLSWGINPSYQAVYTNPQQGYVAWRRTFVVPKACVKGAHLQFDLLGVDNSVNRILVNGNALTIPPIKMWYTYGLSFNIQPFILPGQTNEIIIETYNIDEWCSLKVHGYIALTYCGSMDISLKDKNRVEKDEYCLEEEVFLDVQVADALNYQVQIEDMTNALSDHSQLFNGTPTNINLTKLFAIFPFVPGNAMKVKIGIQMSSCGFQWIEKTFKFKCCSNSANAMFTSSIKNGVFSARALGGAVHDWKVYKLSSATGQPLTPYPKSYNTPEISATGSSCYFVRHAVSNACGTDCKSQRLCDKPCTEADPCLLPAPTGAQFNQANGTFSWNSVPGAVFYILDVIHCDPACCPISKESDPYNCDPVFGGGAGPNVSLPYGSLTVMGTSRVFNAADFGFIGPVNCFSWHVYAVCENGAKGLVSSNCATTF